MPRISISISVIFLGALLFCFVGAEIGLRAFHFGNYYSEIPSGEIIDPYIRNDKLIFGIQPWLWTYPPRIDFIQIRGDRKTPYQINSRGFRSENRNADYPPKNGKKRLLMIGDSMVEGHGVDFDTTFTYLLNDKVKDKNWDVLNLGMSGASPVYYAANLRRYLALAPDIVVLVLYENDLVEDRIREKALITFPFLDDPKLITANVNGDVVESLLSGIGFYDLKTIQVLERAVNLWRQQPFNNLVAENLKTDLAQTPEELASNREVSHVVPERIFADSWKKSERFLDYFRESLQEQNVKLLVVSLSFGKWDSAEDQSKRDKFVQVFDNTIENWSNKNNLPYRSLGQFTNETIKNNNSEELIIKLNGHPTEKMHKMLADELLPFVEKNLN